MVVNLLDAGSLFWMADKSLEHLLVLPELNSGPNVIISKVEEEFLKHHQSRPTSIDREGVARPFKSIEEVISKCGIRSEVKREGQNGHVNGEIKKFIKLVGKQIEGTDKDLIARALDMSHEDSVAIYTRDGKLASVAVRVAKQFRSDIKPITPKTIKQKFTKNLQNAGVDILVPNYVLARIHDIKTGELRPKYGFKPRVVVKENYPYILEKECKLVDMAVGVAIYPRDVPRKKGWYTMPIFNRGVSKVTPFTDSFGYYDGGFVSTTNRAYYPEFYTKSARGFKPANWARLNRGFIPADLGKLINGCRR